jgi:biopolymer transport protein ExbD
MRLNNQLPRRRAIGLTALIDVVFLLLVFFMLASTFLKFGNVKIDLGGAEPAMGDLSKIVMVHVGKEKRVTVDGEDVPTAALADRLAHLKREGRERVVVAVRADAAVSDMLGIVGVVRRSGFAAVQVVK